MNGFRNIKKRQTKPDLLISSVFSKHHPPMNNFKKKNICKIRPIPEQNLNRLRQQKSFCSKKKSSRTQNSIPNLIFCNCFRKHLSNPSPRTKTLLLNFAKKNDEFLKKKNLNHSRRQKCLFCRRREALSPRPPIQQRAANQT